MLIAKSSETAQQDYCDILSKLEFALGCFMGARRGTRL